MTLSLKSWMVFLLAYCPVLLGGASPSAIIVSPDLDQRANSASEYILDKTGSLSLSDVLKKTDGWKAPESDNLVFDLPSTTLWVRLRFQNDQKTTQTVYLELNPVFLEKIEAFDETGKSLDRTGSTVATERLESFPTLRLEVPPGNSIRYVSIQSRSNSLNIRARSQARQERQAYFDLATFCVLFGGLLSLMVYHLFLFATYRHWTYFFYSLFVAATTLFTVSFCSFHKFLLPATFLGFHVDFWWSALSAPILLLGMFLFSASLLNLYPSRPFLTKKNRLQLALLTLPLFEVFCILGVFLTDDPATLIPIRFSGALHVLVLPTLGILLWTRDRSNTISLYYAFSWIPFAMGAFFIVAWLSGAVEHHAIYAWSLPIGALFQSVLLSFAAGQQLNVVTRDKLREQKDKLRVMGELEIEVEKLSRRDRVITTFVSRDIVDELDRSEDPLQYLPRNVNKCIVFIDMHNYTTFFETHSAYECQSILNQYFKMINDTTYAGGGKVDKIIGDAMMLHFDDAERGLKTIVQLRRVLSEANRSRFSKNQAPLKFGLGAAYGTILSANFGSSHKYDRTLVGDPVNVAARLEAITRQFSVDVLCSKEFVDLQHSYQYTRPAGYVLLKGRQKKSLVYECFEHHPPQVVEWKLSTKPAIQEVIQLELAGKYVEALAVIQSLIDSCPPHTRKPDTIMDMTLVTMREAIREKMRQLELRVPTTEIIKSKQEYKRAA